MKTVDLIQPCSNPDCAQKWYVFDNSTKPACPFCGTKYKGLHFREIKITLNMDVLRCTTPHMIERELRMQFIAYNMIRSVMQKAAITHNKDLSRISFMGCLDTVREFASAMNGVGSKAASISILIDKMLATIAADLNPHRPGRSEPRAKKRRRKNYRLLTKARNKMGKLPNRKAGIEIDPKIALS